MESSQSFVALTFIVLWVIMMPVQAEPYVEFSTGNVYVDTPSETAQPILFDMRAGITRPQHQFELALMSSVQDDEINQLTVKTPVILSALWHYIPVQTSTLKVHTILGISSVEVDANLAGLGTSNEKYSGISFGLGFEERFDFNHQLKMTLDLLQLYAGDDVDIYSVSLGVHYDF